MTFLRLRAALMTVMLFLVWTAVSSGGNIHAQTLGEAEHFTANAMDINTGQTGLIEIQVNRWSTNAERTALTQTLFKKGSQGLLEALRDARSVGRIYSTGSIGYDLRYAYQRKLPDGGREIILATDRPMSHWELTNQPRSAEYPFTWVQFQISPDGKGEGKLAVAARIIGEEADQLIEVEDYALRPVRLVNIKATKGKR
jgi:hypothetical protein